MIFSFFEVMLLIYFSASVLYLLIFCIAGLFKSSSSFSKASKINKIALLVPAYKEDEVIIHTAKEIATLDYESVKFKGFIIADKLKPATIKELKKIPQIEVLEVNFETSTKAKSLNYALNTINDTFDIACILDADNILEKKYLKKINSCFESKHNVIQTRRVAKNLGGVMEILDGISEQINNHIFRKGHNNLGISSSFIGSGMVFPFDLLKKYLNKVQAIGGFDRELQLLLMKDKYFIKYLPSALVYDEKISNKNQFRNQRKRWISSQFVYLRRSFNEAIVQLFKGNFNYFNLAFFHNVFFPKFLNFGFIFIITSVLFVLSPILESNYKIWAGILLIHLLVLLISTPKVFYNWRFVKVLFALPGTFLSMLLSLLHIKGANKTFIHTKHTSVDVDNQIFKAE